jgi:F-box and leucine-rich repeat protein GRR1
MPELVAVDLSGLTKTKDEVVQAIAKTSERLQGLNLIGCTAVTDKGIIALAEQSALLRRVRALELLFLCGQDAEDR